MSLDESDKQQRGELSGDPKEGTKVVAVQVPRVLTAREILVSSAMRAMKRDSRDHCTMGHYKLDKITGGFRPGFVWVMGADTSWGKSSFLISVVDENMKRGKRCLIVSSEDTEEVYGDRLMVRRARVDALRFRDKRLNAAEMATVLAVAEKGEPIPVFVDAARWPIEKLVLHLDKIVKEQNIDLVAFDYLGEFKSEKRWQDERVKFREISSIMRRVIKANKKTGIIFSQLTITSDTKIPNKHNIRECRDVANAAEGILMGFEPEIDVKRDPEPEIKAGTKCVFIDKVKNGPRGAKIAMDWDRDSACFNTVLDPDAQRAADIIGDQFDDFGDAQERYP